MSVGSNSLGGNGTAFALMISLEYPTVLLIETGNDLTRDGENICLLIMEFLLCIAVGDFSRYKKIHYWVVLNTALLPPFLKKSGCTRGTGTRIGVPQDAHRQGKGKGIKIF